MPTVAAPSAEAVRAWFPALNSDFVFLENAGGSQIPRCVADAMHEYMLQSYVQLGAPYSISVSATDVVARAHSFIETFMGSGDSGRVVLGPSTTALVNIVANAYAEVLKPGDEIIVAQTNHEANAGPWERLSGKGVVIKWWPVDQQSFTLSLDSLGELLGPRTKLVAFPHVSNLLGDIVDVAAVTEMVHRAGAKVFVDGVAYAPHGLIDVAAWKVDWYVYSTYKVYGPHMAALYGSHEAFSELTGPNHFFIDRSNVPLKFELGSISHEGCAGLLALDGYLRFLGGHGEGGRETISSAVQAMHSLELPHTERLLSYLQSKSGVTVVGPSMNSPRVGTVSFVSDRIASTDVAANLCAQGIGIRAGHMYALRLCRALGIDEKDGVVRISLLHYNTASEIDRTIAALDRIL